MKELSLATAVFAAAANVRAAATNYLLRSTDGLHFQRVDLPALNSGNRNGIQAIDFVGKDQGFVRADGVIWRLTAEDRR